MSTSNPNPGRSIDERLEFLLQSNESHNEQIGKLGERVDQLTATVERHEREQERFRRMMKAALLAWLEGEDGTEGEAQ